MDGRCKWSGGGRCICSGGEPLGGIIIIIIIIIIIVTIIATIITIIIIIIIIITIKGHQWISGESGILGGIPGKSLFLGFP